MDCKWNSHRIRRRHMNNKCLLVCCDLAHSLQFVFDYSIITRNVLIYQKKGNYIWRRRKKANVENKKILLMRDDVRVFERWWDTFLAQQKNEPTYTHTYTHIAHNHYIHTHTKHKLWREIQTKKKRILYESVAFRRLISFSHRSDKMYRVQMDGWSEKDSKRRKTSPIERIHTGEMKKTDSLRCVHVELKLDG